MSNLRPLPTWNLHPDRAPSVKGGRELNAIELGQRRASYLYLGSLLSFLSITPVITLWGGSKQSTNLVGVPEAWLPTICAPAAEMIPCCCCCSSSQAHAHLTTGFPRFLCGFCICKFTHAMTFFIFKIHYIGGKFTRAVGISTLPTPPSG